MSLQADSPLHIERVELRTVDLRLANGIDRKLSAVRQPDVAVFLLG